MVGKKSKSKISITIWVIGYLVIAFILYLFLHRYLSTESSFIDWISVYGVYTTMYSLVLMFVQFKSIRDVSEETKNKLNKTVAISDLSRYSELIRSVEMDVRKDSIDVALYKTQNIKALVHKIMILEEEGDNSDEDYDNVNSILATHINSYNEWLLQNGFELNKGVILKELEDVTTFFQRKSNEMINNID